MTLPKVEWFPPDGSGAVTFGPDGVGDFRMTNLLGVSSTQTNVLSRKSAGQVGSTVIDRTVATRTVALQCLIDRPDVSAYNTDLAVLTKALAGVPGTTTTPDLGTLRLHQPGLPVVETKAEPVESPREAVRSGSAAIIDIEWFCPSPLWREITDQIVTLEPAPGDPWVSPWFSPWFSPAAQASAEAINTGHVPVGVLVRFFGVQDTVRLVNVTTGEQLQVFGPIGSGEIVEVDTEARTVTVDGVSALDRWDFDGTWLKLRPGSQTIVAEANTAQAGARTVVLWRNAVAGV